MEERESQRERGDVVASNYPLYVLLVTSESYLTHGMAWPKLGLKSRGSARTTIRSSREVVSLA